MTLATSPQTITVNRNSNHNNKWNSEFFYERSSSSGDKRRKGINWVSHKCAMVFAVWGISSGLLMFLVCALVVVFVTNVPSAVATGGSVAPATLNGRNDVFTSSFLVRFRRSVDNELASAVATRYGFDNIGPVSTQKRKANAWMNAIIFIWAGLLGKSIRKLECEENFFCAKI